MRSSVPGHTVALQFACFALISSFNKQVWYNRDTSSTMQAALRQDSSLNTEAVEVIESLGARCTAPDNNSQAECIGPSACSLAPIGSKYEGNKKISEQAKSEQHIDMYDQKRDRGQNGAPKPLSASTAPYSHSSCYGYFYDNSSSQWDATAQSAYENGPNEDVIHSGMTEKHRKSSRRILQSKKRDHGKSQPRRFPSRFSSIKTYQERRRESTSDAGNDQFNFWTSPLDDAPSRVEAGAGAAPRVFAAFEVEDTRKPRPPMRERRFIRYSIWAATVLGAWITLAALIFAIRSDTFQSWSAAKDFYEFCQEADEKSTAPACQNLVGKKLGRPPYGADRFFEDVRRPLNTLSRGSEVPGTATVTSPASVAANLTRPRLRRNYPGLPSWVFVEVIHDYSSTLSPSTPYSTSALSSQPSHSVESLSGIYGGLSHTATGIDANKPTPIPEPREAVDYPRPTSRLTSYDFQG